MRAHIAVKEAKNLPWAKFAARCPDGNWRAFSKQPKLNAEGTDWDYSDMESSVLGADDKWKDDIFTIMR